MNYACDTTCILLLNNKLWKQPTKHIDSLYKNNKTFICTTFNVFTCIRVTSWSKDTSVKLSNLNKADACNLW